MSEDKREWRARSARLKNSTDWIPGETLLIAAMRCYVIGRLGDEIDVPEHLLEIS